jgi:hypothetical protein
MSIKAIRVSNTSIKSWDLHGPIDQALKTSMQADSVRFFPLDVNLHGDEVKMELWIDAAEITEETEKSVNPYAMVFLRVQKIRDEAANLTADTPNLGNVIVGLATMNMSDMDPIAGIAILTGAGGTDVPDHAVSCIFQALMGQQVH